MLTQDGTARSQSIADEVARSECDVLRQCNADLALGLRYESDRAKEALAEVERLTTRAAIDPAVLARVQDVARFGRQRRSLAVPVDLPDLEDMLKALGAER